MANFMMNRLNYFTLALVVMSLVACDEPETLEPPSVPDDAILVSESRVPICLPTIGSMFPDQQIEVTSRIAGYIRTIKVAEGEPVKKGQLLAIIDDSSVKGGILNLEAKVNQAKNALNDISLDKERFTKLFEAGSVTENQFRKIQLGYNLAVDNLAAAKAGLEVARAQRSYTHIISPVDGNVAEIFQQEGDMALPGMPITRVETVNKLELRTYIPESYINLIQLGDSVNVQIDALTDSDGFDGTVSRIVPSSSLNAHRYQVHVAPNNKVSALPGMFGRALFTVGSEEQILIPVDSLQKQGGLQGIYIYNKYGEKVFRWLRTGNRWGNAVEIDAGLSVGEFIAPSSPEDAELFSNVIGEQANVDAQESNVINCQ